MFEEEPCPNCLSFSHKLAACMASGGGGAATISSTAKGIQDEKDRRARLKEQRERATRRVDDIARTVAGLREVPYRR